MRSRLAASHPERVRGAVLIGARIDLDAPAGAGPGPRLRSRAGPRRGLGPVQRRTIGARDWPGFAEFFFEQVFTEPHSTKQIEDMVGWALETDPETIIGRRARPVHGPAATACGGATDEPPRPCRHPPGHCPTLVIHGDGDRSAASRSDGDSRSSSGRRSVMLEGSGHAPLGRDPVKVNLLIRDFVASAGAPGR